MTVNELYGSGVIPKIGDTRRMLLVKLVALGAGSGGGGGGGGVGGGGITSGHYGGLQPPFSPVSAAAASIDLDNGRIWWWYSNQWN